MLNLLHLIGFPVEVAEQVDENYHVRHEEVGECLWYFTVHREDHHQIAQHYHELNLP